MELFAELVGAGIRPPVLILRWSPMGNHFQAVHYKTEDYAYYANSIVTLAETRNRILVKHGWKALDAIGYDVDKTTEAATGALTELRQQATEEEGTASVPTRAANERKAPRTIAMEVEELRRLEKTPQIQVKQESARVPHAAAESLATEMKGTGDIEVESGSGGGQVNTETEQRHINIGKTGGRKRSQRVDGDGRLPESCLREDADGRHA
jgi:hypothetical protein